MVITIKEETKKMETFVTPTNLKRKGNMKDGA